MARVFIEYEIDGDAKDLSTEQLEKFRRLVLEITTQLNWEIVNLTYKRED